MEDLKNIISENIEWFWANDPLVENETDIDKLWNGFKLWCIPNCKENFDNLDETIIEEEVNNNYLEWKTQMKM